VQLAPLRALLDHPARLRVARESNEQHDVVTARLLDVPLPVMSAEIGA
jgi:hypothetical protein